MVAWDSEGYDTDGIHSNVTNNSRLTVPAGVTKVRLSYAIATDLVGANADLFADLNKNGSLQFLGGHLSIADTSAVVPRVSGITPVISVTAGDYFEVALFIPGDASVTIAHEISWFAMEIIA